MLAIAEEAGYQRFITADQEIRYQQNLTGRKMAILVLSTNNWDFIRAAIGAVTIAIESTTVGGYVEVTIPE